MTRYKSERSQACDIPQAVKDAVWERDRHRCVLCLSPQAMPNAHYIPRSAGGLGVEKNIVTLCFDCHRQYDQSTQRPHLQAELRAYLQYIYKGDWDEASLRYRG